MPELPEVECLTRSIRQVILGGSLIRAEFHRADLRWPIPIADFQQLITGQKILSVERRSKYLIVETQAGFAIFHLGMSGNIFFSLERQPTWKHTHASFEIEQEGKSSGFLHFVDPRRFGSILCCQHQDLQNHRLMKSLGPEPLQEIELGRLLWERGHKKSVPVKSFLMDAQNVVGVGNIYANEALFLAKILPFRKTSLVKRLEWKRLATAVQTVLENAIQAGGTSFRDYKHMNGESGYFKVSLSVYGRAEQPCVRCSQAISLRKLGGRATFFCPHCQR